MALLRADGDDIPETWISSIHHDFGCWANAGERNQLSIW
jgi:hypothetical protein